MTIEGFDYDNHLTGEIKKGLANDGKINQAEAAFMVRIIDKYGRKNIKIRKNELVKLGKEFGLNYSKISKMGPILERRLRKKANIQIYTKNELGNLKINIPSKISNLTSNFLKRLENSELHP